MGKHVYILRGIPGCGKSTLADTLLKLSIRSINCCADDYFMVDGEYKFNIDKIGQAHLQCQNKFENALLDEIDIIVVSNTSTRERDVNWYRKRAIESGYMVTVLTVENWHQGQDIHSVPTETKQAMKQQLQNSIKL